MTLIKETLADIIKDLKTGDTDDKIISICLLILIALLIVALIMLVVTTVAILTGSLEVVETEHTHRTSIAPICTLVILLLSTLRK